MRAGRSLVVGGIAAFPCAVLAAFSLWWSVAELAGAGLWLPDTVTLAEAIATRNNAEALRLIGLGANPNERGRVRSGMLTDGYDVTMLPVEAAVGAQREDSLLLLIEHGAIVDPPLARRLRCYERVRSDRGIRAILERVSSEPLDCAGVRLPTERPTAP